MTQLQLSVYEAQQRAERIKAIRKGEVEEKCQGCGNLFKLNREWQKFCSSRCRIAKHNEGREDEKDAEIAALKAKIAELSK